MTPDELRTSLQALGMTQLELSRLVDTEGRTVRRWVSGESSVPGCIEVLIGVWLAHPETVVTSKRDRMRRGDTGLIEVLS